MSWNSSPTLNPCSSLSRCLPNGHSDSFTIPSNYSRGTAVLYLAVCRVPDHAVIVTSDDNNHSFRAKAKATDGGAVVLLRWGCWRPSRRGNTPSYAYVCSSPRHMHSCSSRLCCPGAKQMTSAILRVRLVNRFVSFHFINLSAAWYWGQ